MSNFEKKIERSVKLLLLPKFPFIKDFEVTKDIIGEVPVWDITFYIDYNEMENVYPHLMYGKSKIYDEMNIIKKDILNLRLYELMINYEDIKEKPQNTIEEQYDNIKTPPTKIVQKVLKKQLKELFPEIINIRVENGEKNHLLIYVIVDGTEQEFEDQLYYELPKIMTDFFNFNQYTIQVFVEGDEDLPFDEKIEEGYRERIFSKDLVETDLKWHWDEQDRLVSPTHKTDWMFQFDNELPITLEEDEEIFIPKGRYHRVIKGTGDLKVKVKFL